MSDINERLSKHVKSKEDPMPGLADSALGGVTVAFLSQVFGYPPAKTKSKLVNCPIMETRKRGRTQTQHLYDLAQQLRIWSILS